MPGKQAKQYKAFSKVADPMKVPAAPVAAATQVPKRTHAGSQKKKFCMYNLQGVCKYSDGQCSFAHSLEEMHEARKPAPKAAVSRKQDSPQWKEACLYDGLQESKLQPGGLPSSPSSRGQQVKDWAQMEEPMFVKPSPLGGFNPCVGQVWMNETTAWSQDSTLSSLPPFPSLEEPSLPYNPIPSLPPPLAGGITPFGVPEPPGLSDVTCNRTLEWLTR